MTVGVWLAKRTDLRKKHHLEFALHLANCERLVEAVSTCQQQQLGH